MSIKPKFITKIAKTLKFNTSSNGKQYQAKRKKIPAKRVKRITKLKFQTVYRSCISHFL